MTGCKGYDLRGSDAMTEIERTKEADTPGEIPGRSGLQADRRTGLKWLTALTVDPEAKRQMLGLARKMETEVDESWYEAFYHHLRMEMDEYRRLKRSLRVLKSYTDYEEDLYDEAV